MAADTSTSFSSKYPSIYIAPLQIGASGRPKPFAQNEFEQQQQLQQLQREELREATRSEQPLYATSSAQMTPPLTPHGSMEDLQDDVETSQPMFHNFLRAFYPYQPDHTTPSHTVTLPLNEGDIVLVHSIHTNGWADGTLLVSGARGWLPTNYCEAYDQEPIRILLKALLSFWDLLTGDLSCNLNVFGNQEYMRGMIAGVRFLLERSGCLTRESATIKAEASLRKNRKALLSDLSALVKTTKRLKDIANGVYLVENVEDVVDEMTMKAFKLVTRGVKFLDIWNEKIATGRIYHRNGFSVPPTPPADVSTFGVAVSEDLPQGSCFGSFVTPESYAVSDANVVQPVQTPAHDPPVEQTKRISSTPCRSSISSRPGTSLSSRTISRPASGKIHRLSASHRFSNSGRSVVNNNNNNRCNLASQQLSATHDAFLSLQGSFIGRLHLQSRSSPDLLETTHQSVAACRDLLAVVETVWERDNRRADSLLYAKDAMYGRITGLIGTAREIFRSSSSIDDREDIMVPEESNLLMSEATACVMAAGECVARTKYVIEKIGDFEFEPVGLGIASALASLSNSPENVDDTGDLVSGDVQPHGLADALSIPPEPMVRPPPPPPFSDRFSDAGRIDVASAAEDVPTGFSTGDDSPTAPSTSSTAPIHAPSDSPLLLPPVPHLSSPLLVEGQFNHANSPVPIHAHVQSKEGPAQAQASAPAASQSLRQQPVRMDSFDVGSTGSNSTYISSMRDSETSIVSQTSTRATTPDHTGSKCLNTPTLSVCPSANGSQLTLADECEETEAKVLETTFAHELICNKDGQITGGTLPALIERLTTHDATPDSLFVSTFYLTFRLFTTPCEFAEALVQRFDYVADSPQGAGPVRLRVYNVFKGWMESHWRNESDSVALNVIVEFANTKLANLLPGAGKRLAELANKVSSVDRPLVPRLISSIGKTNTSIAPYVAPDTPLPTPSITKGQMALLKNWKQGGSTPNILDFDALELARQLTIKESKIFCSILPEELLAQEWTKKAGSLAVNVRAMSTLSTDLATLVADTILQFEDTKKRATIIKQWVKIANHCLELNNYDSLMAIICSINSSTILRLKRTWEVVSQKTKVRLENLRGIVEVSRNYAVLRQRLQGHVPPCLPFVGIYLTDLTFVDVGNGTTRQLPGDEGSQGTSVINFDKHMKTAKIIGELQRFQIPYRLNEIPEVQDWMNAQVLRVRSTDQANVQKYYRRSLLLEPREQNQSQRTSPIEPPSAGKDKFDFLSWSHYTKDKAVAAAQS
ncbi:MAG: hypothetical protein M1825_003389 [Sarcosagium campestre]|nr:MAG: hypothetical protein M1825_003389 [Sarcosagium campestre]